MIVFAPAKFIPLPYSLSPGKIGSCSDHFSYFAIFGYNFKQKVLGIVNNKILGRATTPLLMRFLSFFFGCRRFIGYVCELGGMSSSVIDIQHFEET